MKCNLKAGDRIRLVHMADDPDPVPTGELGTVVSVAELGDWIQVDVDWDCGRKLMLVVPPDQYSLLSNPAFNS